jgi:hypothetical protein
MAATYVNTPYESVSLQALTEAAPTTVADGFSVSPAVGYYLVLASVGATTLSGAGTLLAYVWDSFIGAWARAPDLDWAVPSGVSGFKYAASPVYQNAAPRKGQIAYIASGVTVSGGTTCNVYILSFPRGAAFAKV